jgi:hypothetical protein
VRASLAPLLLLQELCLLEAIGEIVTTAAMTLARFCVFVTGLLLLQFGCARHHDVSSTVILKPRLTGDSWKITGDPDLGELTTTNQQPVDFGIWQAADGTWQVWSCIRKTKERGNTRLFYRWEGKKLTDTDWKPMGIAMQADEKLGERRGGLQAPYVFREGNRIVMAYGSWDHICLAESTDGKMFKRILSADGKAPLFGEGEGNTRDPMVLRVGDQWYCYYTAHPKNIGADYCRTSANLRDWSASHVVARGGTAGGGAYSAECPFVIELERGKYYLFRTQHYGEKAQTSVYFSRNPLDFGVDNDESHFVCTLPVAAPEVFKYDGKWYIASLLPSLKGIQINRLAWEQQNAGTK